MSPEISGVPVATGKNRMSLTTNPLRPATSPVQFPDRFANPRSPEFVPRGRRCRSGCVLGPSRSPGWRCCLCALDLFTGVPFGGGPYVLADIGGIVTAGILIYLAFNAYQDVK